MALDSFLHFNVFTVLFFWSRFSFVLRNCISEQIIVSAEAAVVSLTNDSALISVMMETWPLMT